MDQLRIQKSVQVQFMTFIIYFHKQGHIPNEKNREYSNLNCII